MTESATTLAYVFWHSAAPPALAYQADLLAFHASLAADPPSGFIRSQTSGLAGASWLGAAQESYEDWYLVEGWAAIGELNRQAVASPHATSHDQIAHQAGSGAGALYGLDAGDASAPAPVRTWFAKPEGWSYDRLAEALAVSLGKGGSLWRRQLVLGPAPEFCLRAEHAVDLPPGIEGERVGYRPLP
jgi:hypothetical protein